MSILFFLLNPGHMPQQPLLNLQCLNKLSVSSIITYPKCLPLLQVRLSSTFRNIVGSHLDNLHFTLRPVNPSGSSGGEMNAMSSCLYLALM